MMKTGSACGSPARSLGPRGSGAALAHASEQTDLISSITQRATASQSVTLWLSDEGSSAAQGAQAAMLLLDGGKGTPHDVLTSLLQALLGRSPDGRGALPATQLKFSCVTVQGSSVTDLVLACQLRECEPALGLSSAAGLATFEAATWKNGAVRQHVHELSDAITSINACQALLAGMLKRRAPAGSPQQPAHTVVQLHVSKSRNQGLEGRRSGPLEGRRSNPMQLSRFAVEGRRRRRRPFGGQGAPAVNTSDVHDCCIQLVGLAGMDMATVARTLQRLAKSGVSAETPAPGELGASLWAVVRPVLYSSSLVMTLELQDARATAAASAVAAALRGSASTSSTPAKQPGAVPMPEQVSADLEIMVAADCAPEPVPPITEKWQTWEEAAADALAMSRFAQMAERLEQQALHIAGLERTKVVLQGEVHRLLALLQARGIPADASPEVTLHGARNPSTAAAAQSGSPNPSRPASVATSNSGTSGATRAQPEYAHSSVASHRVSDSGSDSQPVTPCVLGNDAELELAGSGSVWSATPHSGVSSMVTAWSRSPASSIESATAPPQPAQPAAAVGSPVRTRLSFAGAMAASPPRLRASPRKQQQQQSLEEQLRLASIELAATKRQLGTLSKMLALVAERAPSLKLDVLQDEVELLRDEYTASTTRLMATEHEFATVYLKMQHQALMLNKLRAQLARVAGGAQSVVAAEEAAGHTTTQPEDELMAAAPPAIITRTVNKATLSSSSERPTTSPASSKLSRNAAPAPAPAPAKPAFGTRAVRCNAHPTASTTRNAARPTTAEPTSTTVKAAPGLGGKATQRPTTSRAGKASVAPLTVTTPVVVLSSAKKPRSALPAAAAAAAAATAPAPSAPGRAPRLSATASPTCTPAGQQDQDEDGLAVELGMPPRIACL